MKIYVYQNYERPLEEREKRKETILEKFKVSFNKLDIECVDDTFDIPSYLLFPGNSFARRRKMWIEGKCMQFIAESDIVVFVNPRKEPISKVIDKAVDSFGIATFYIEL